MKMHFIGSHGASMSQLIRLVEKQGIQVSGSDLVSGGHFAANVLGADAIIYTSAIPHDNVELLQARKLKIPSMERAELLGQISKNYHTTIAIAGAHGKTSTTAMTGAALFSRNPTVHVGGDGIGAGGFCIGNKNYFVTEACEYRRNFLYLKPDIAVILNVAMDHTDYYTDIDDLWGAYNSFANNSQAIIAHTSVAQHLSKKDNITTVGDNGNYCARKIVQNKTSLSFDCYEDGKLLGAFEVNALGRHNAQNSLFAIAVGRRLGLEYQELFDNLQRFLGVKRRFEIVKVGQNGIIVSDYAHHPDEIVVSIKTARQLAKKVRVIFQSHTYSRTLSLLDNFVDALRQADTVALIPIYGAREKDNASTLNSDFANKIPAPLLTEDSDIMSFISAGDKDNITIVMGAGPIDKYARANEVDIEK